MTVIASFNINSVNARLPNLLEWLRERTPDIVCLQEIKCLTAGFPAEPFAELGYNSIAVGQKSYNGVAVLSRSPIEVLEDRLPGDPEDGQARYLEVLTRDMRVACIYLPNGNPVGTDRFTYKLAWMERLRQHATDLLEDDGPVVLAGDFNVIPEPRDCHDPVAWEGDALFTNESRGAFRSLVNLGFYDAFRVRHPNEERAFTFWDYQQLAFQLGHGIRIDHLLLSAPAVDRLKDCWIDKDPRRRAKASDHTPILCELVEAPLAVDRA